MGRQGTSGGSALSRGSLPRADSGGAGSCPSPPRLAMGPLTLSPQPCPPSASCSPLPNAGLSSFFKAAEEVLPQLAQASSESVEMVHGKRSLRYKLSTDSSWRSQRGDHLSLGAPVQEGRPRLTLEYLRGETWIHSGESENGAWGENVVLSLELWFF